MSLRVSAGQENFDSAFFCHPREVLNDIINHSINRFFFEETSSPSLSFPFSYCELPRKTVFACLWLVSIQMDSC